MQTEEEAVLLFFNGTNGTTTEKKKVHNFEGFTVQTDTYVRIITGPVVGKVTATSAVILLEVSGKSE